MFHSRSRQRVDAGHDTSGPVAHENDRPEGHVYSRKCWKHLRDWIGEVAVVIVGSTIILWMPSLRECVDRINEGVLYDFAAAGVIVSYSQDSRAGYLWIRDATGSSRGVRSKEIKLGPDVLEEGAQFLKLVRTRQCTVNGKTYDLY